MKTAACLCLLLSGALGLNFIQDCVFANPEAWYDPGANERGFFAQNVLFGEVAHVLKSLPPCSSQGLDAEKRQWVKGETPTNLWLVMKTASNPSGFKTKFLRKCVEYEEPELIYLKLKNFVYTPACVDELEQVQLRNRRLIAYSCRQKVRSDGTRVVRVNNAVFKQGYVASYDADDYDIADYHFFLLQRNRCSGTLYDQQNQGARLCASNP